MLMQSPGTQLGRRFKTQPAGRPLFARHDGGIKPGTLVFLLLIAVVIYTAYGFLPPWMAYRAMKEQMQDQARTVSVIPDEEIVERVYATAKEWSVPIKKDEILVKRTESHLTIATRWEVAVDIFGGLYQYPLVFAPEVDELLLPISR
jgi:type III secretion system FlhB-like substrate exporter